MTTILCKIMSIDVIWASETDFIIPNMQVQRHKDILFD